LHRHPRRMAKCWPRTFSPGWRLVTHIDGFTLFLPGVVMQIRRYEAEDIDAIVRLSLRAWAPVFVSIEQALDADVYLAMHPDWRVDQEAAVCEVCGDKEMQVWVADVDGTVAGFVAARHRPDDIGEIYMLAVDPDFQQRGFATTLNETALSWMKEAGISVAMVETGGDPGHAPARSTYERSGFRLMPVARYFKKL